VCVADALCGNDALCGADALCGDDALCGADALFVYDDPCGSVSVVRGTQSVVCSTHIVRCARHKHIVRCVQHTHS